jgi:hypothetical protein
VSERVLAESDCERCRDGLVTQPVNAISSAAYVVAGGAMVRRARIAADLGGEALGWATVGVGIGSVAYHGPGGVLSRYVHDAGLLAMLGVLALQEVGQVTGKPVTGTQVAAVTGAAAVGARPRTSEAVQIVVGTLAAATVAARVRVRGSSSSDRLDGAGMVVGGAAQVLGRSGGPWCRPDSLLQVHALWHVATAAVLWHRGARRSPVARATGRDRI